MKAMVYTEYGTPDVLHLSDVPKPTPKDDEILVRVRATDVGFGDLMARQFNAFTPRSFNMPVFLWLPSRLTIGVSKPKKHILGSEFAGEVEAVGSAVTRFKPGDQVFGYPSSNFGAYAEYICMSEKASVMLKPANMTYEEATTVPYGALTALNLLKKVDIHPGQKILINGASGSIGAAALQLAKSYGAHVTAVCGTQRLEYVKALGADKVIDYTQEDFTRNGETYDVIFDILGKTSFARCKNSLKPNGRLLYASFKMKQLFQMLWTSIRGGKRVICALAMDKQADLAQIRELVEAGKIKAILDRCYPLAQAAEAHRYAESGQKRGSIVITLAANA